MATNLLVKFLPLHNFSTNPSDIVYIVETIEVTEKNQLIHGPFFCFEEIICYLIQIILLHIITRISLTNQTL
ncbi:Uncharacterised protein [Streptococcus pneumoniae]|nr:Uncharacterised protein [Streptococcus pneumoniae]